MAAGGHGDTGRMGSLRHQLKSASVALPTPTSRDWRSGKASEATWARPQARPLNETLERARTMVHTPTTKGNQTAPSMQKWAGARALAALLQNHGLTGTAALPVTYGWMMGYPPGWLSNALRSAVQKGLLLPPSSSKRSATRSSRKSPKPSAEPSSE